MENQLKQLSKESLQKIVLEMTPLLSDEQYCKLEGLIAAYSVNKQENLSKLENLPKQQRMSQELVDDKMQQIHNGIEQIEEGKLYLTTEEYEDYSSGYYDRDWITEYYDNQGIGDIIIFAARFAKDCVDDYRYPEANEIYEWLWDMYVSTDCEYDDEGVDLETMAENDIVKIDMEQLALLTLYAEYQVQEPEKRAEGMYHYFLNYSFKKLHLQDMFHVGREALDRTAQFWEDWIALLETNSGDAEARLLQEAILYNEGIEGLVKRADKNCKSHPSLYLTAMNEYDKNHDYSQIEIIGEKALEKIDVSLKIRSEIALKAASASSCLAHTEKVILFCWECFKSDSTDKNYLRLFGTQKMAELYGKRGKEVLASRIKGNPGEYTRNAELCQNIIGEYGYHTLSFYMGDFKTVQQVSKNPQGSLGWSNSFISHGIRLFLLYLYEGALPSKAAAQVAGYVGFRDNPNMDSTLDFENEIIEESHKHKVSIFWNYFQRWKQYFLMEAAEKKTYLSWAEKIVYARADAIVGGQHRNQYGEVAALLAIVGEIKESQGESNAKQEIFAVFKGKFPRHSSFQAEMKNYFYLQ